MGNTKNSYIQLSDNELVQNGSDNAFDELAMRYLKTINCIARRFTAQGYDHNDFVQEGLLGLLYSFKTYNLNGNASFKSYMSIIIERRFISIIRKSNAQHTIPTANLVQIADISEKIEDTAQNPEELLLCREHLDTVVEKLKALLSKTEYDVLILYGSGLSYKQIAEKLSISEKSADNALQRARRKICSRDMS